MRTMGRAGWSGSPAVVITGAASGIGRALAQEYAARGARVALLDVDEPALEAAAAGLANATAHRCDVASAAAVDEARDAVLAAHGAVHLLVCNAGISAAGPVEALPLDVFRRTMDVNFWGVVHACRSFLPALRATAVRCERAGLAIVLSDFALLSLPTKAAYAASKHAAKAFTEALAAELQGSGVRVSAIYPGATATDIVRRGHAVDPAKRDAEAEFLAKGLPPEEVARRIVRAVDAGRARVLIGRDTRAIDLATRLAPGVMQAGVRRLWRRVPLL